MCCVFWRKTWFKNWMTHEIKQTCAHIGSSNDLALNSLFSSSSSQTDKPLNNQKLPYYSCLYCCMSIKKIRNGKCEEFINLSSLKKIVYIAGIEPERYPPLGKHSLGSRCNFVMTWEFSIPWSVMDCQWPEYVAQLVHIFVHLWSLWSRPSINTCWCSLPNRPQIPSRGSISVLFTAQRTRGHWQPITKNGIENSHVITKLHLLPKECFPRWISFGFNSRNIHYFFQTR